MAKLADIAACVFDAYGTLFDVHSAAARHRERMGARADAVSALWRQKQLEYTWLRSLMRRHADFDRVTADALDYALDAHGVAEPALREALLADYRSLGCYPEVPQVLRQLRAAGLPRAVLSNGTPATLKSLAASAGLADLLDPLLSVEEAGIFKPDPRVYQLAVDRLGVPAERIAFLSSNAWDVAGASSFGLRAVWVNRGGARRERLDHGPVAEIATLAELPALLGPPASSSA